MLELRKHQPDGHMSLKVGKHVITGLLLGRSVSLLNLVITKVLMRSVKTTGSLMCGHILVAIIPVCTTYFLPQV